MQTMSLTSILRFFDSIYLMNEEISSTRIRIICYDNTYIIHSLSNQQYLDHGWNAIIGVFWSLELHTCPVRCPLVHCNPFTWKYLVEDSTSAQESYSLLLVWWFHHFHSKKSSIDAEMITVHTYECSFCWY